MSDEEFRRDMEGLDRWGRALARHYTDQTVFQMFMTVATRRLFACDFAASSVAASYRLFAEQIEGANPAAWTIERTIRLADQAMRAASGRQQGTVKRVTDGALRRARVRAHFEELMKTSSSVADAINATANKFGLGTKRVRQITDDLRRK